MSERVKEYNVYLTVKITDEILVEAKNSIEAIETAKELYLEDITGKQAINLIEDNLVVNEVEQAVQMMKMKKTIDKMKKKIIRYNKDMKRLNLLLALRYDISKYSELKESGLL